MPEIKSQYAIPRQQHCISKTDISPNALKVLNRLTSSGYQAFLVGGGVRDLLLRKAPKDFDVATNATPNQVKQLFRNGRIIGRRFKLVHILFHREVIEVATFRAQGDEDTDLLSNDKGMLVRDNVFGTLEDDAWRRDFTINSLYYNHEDGSIIDYTGGVADIKNKSLRMIGDPETRYTEDPVRMLRAIRFAAKLHLQIETGTEEPLYRLNHLISHVSNSRLFDEMVKLYQCGEAESVHRQLMQYGLFALLFPQTQAALASDKPVNAMIGIALENTDTRIRDDKPVNPAFLYAVFLWFPLRARSAAYQEEGLDPLPALDKAMSEVLAAQCRIISIPKRFTQVIREIWLLQFRFGKRQGGRAYNLLEHPRFRAAYDFLAIRALSGDESMELTQWWTDFQEAEPAQRQQMVDLINQADGIKKKRRRRKPKAASA